jgi:hypothetical protein
MGPPGLGRGGGLSTGGSAGGSGSGGFGMGGGGFGWVSGMIGLRGGWETNLQVVRRYLASAARTASAKTSACSGFSAVMM